YPLLFVFSLLQRAPRSTLFPYTTLFRSVTERVECVAQLALVIVDVACTAVVRVARRGIAANRVERGLAMFQRSLGEVGLLLDPRSEEHTSELQSRENLVCRLLLEKKKST